MRRGPNQPPGSVDGGTDRHESPSPAEDEAEGYVEASLRQRDRLQEQIANLDTSLQEERAESRRINRRLQRLSGRPLTRIDRRLSGLTRALRHVVTGAARERPASLRAVDPSVAERLPGPTAFRTSLLAALDDPRRLAFHVVGSDAATGESSATRAIASSLERLGIAARAARQAPAQADVETPEVVLFLDPPGTSIPPGPIRIGWLGDRSAEWIASGMVDEMDIVLVRDADDHGSVTRSTAKSATVIRDPVSADGMERIVTILRDWARARHVSIHVRAMTRNAAATSGDTHFGRAVQRALERRGWPTTVHVFADHDAPAAVRADVALHVFGGRVPPVRTDQASVLWIISHPDMLRLETCRGYDLVAVASAIFAWQVRRWLGTSGPPVIELHQATDPDRFHPASGAPAHPLLFVGSSRGQRRAVVDALAGSGRDLAVYGSQWSRDLLDPRYLAGTWIPNDVLHAYYAAADIVLSDSYPDMRDEGFISNRAYDVLASGGFLLAEAGPGIDTEFDGAIPTFRDRDELLRLVDHYLAHPEERAALAKRGRAAVLARHTFDQRVASLIAAVEPLLAGVAPRTRRTA